MILNEYIQYILLKEFKSNLHQSIHVNNGTNLFSHNFGRVIVSEGIVLFDSNCWPGTQMSTGRFPVADASPWTLCGFPSQLYSSYSISSSWEQLPLGI